jgi:hypothetical protein
MYEVEMKVRDQKIVMWILLALMLLFAVGTAPGTCGSVPMEILLAEDGGTP